MCSQRVILLCQYKTYLTTLPWHSSHKTIKFNHEAIFGNQVDFCKSFISLKHPHVNEPKKKVFRKKEFAELPDHVAPLSHCVTPLQCIQQAISSLCSKNSKKNMFESGQETFSVLFKGEEKRFPNVVSKMFTLQRHSKPKYRNKMSKQFFNIGQLF